MKTVLIIIINLGMCAALFYGGYLFGKLAPCQDVEQQLIWKIPPENAP